MRIDNGTVEISYYALLAYKEQLKKDLETRYDNDPEFGNEDVVFLNDTLERVNKAIEVYLRSERGSHLVRYTE